MECEGKAAPRGSVNRDKLLHPREFLPECVSLTNKPYTLIIILIKMCVLRRHKILSPRHGEQNNIYNVILLLFYYFHNAHNVSGGRTADDPVYYDDYDKVTEEGTCFLLHYIIIA